MMDYSANKNKEYEITCSQFLRLFLIKEAMIIGSNFNTYVNKIFSDYFNWKFDMVSIVVIPIEFRKPLLIEDVNIRVRPDQFFQKFVEHYPGQAIKDIYHNIRRQYVIFKLSDRCIEKNESRKIGQEVINCITRKKSASRLF